MGLSVQNKAVFHLWPLGSNWCAGSFGESLPLENSAFNKLPNQLARGRRAPSLAGRRPPRPRAQPPPLLHFPSVPSLSGRNLVRGRIRFPAFQSENPAKGAAEQRKPQGEAREERDHHRPGGREQQPAPPAAATRVPGPRAANLAPFNKGNLSADSTFATQSKCKGVRHSPRCLRSSFLRQQMMVERVGERLPWWLSGGAGFRN